MDGRRIGVTPIQLQRRLAQFHQARMAIANVLIATLDGQR
jgi:hypothetical protein